MTETFSPEMDCRKNSGDEIPLHGQREEESLADMPEEDQYLLCRQCRKIITHPHERIIQDGSHQHTFANPHGLIFEIGCFASAPGCAVAGPFSNEFTWFKGFKWQVAVCRFCQAHLGWMFMAAGNRFYGLILTQLVESRILP